LAEILPDELEIFTDGEEYYGALLLYLCKISCPAIIQLPMVAVSGLNLLSGIEIKLRLISAPEDAK
jgi:hypothetical protein